VCGRGRGVCEAAGWQIWVLEKSRMVAATLAAATRRLNYRCSYCLKKRGRRGGGVSDTFNAPQVTLSCLVWSCLLYYIILYLLLY